MSDETPRPYEVVLPKNALTMTEAVIVEWLKSEGEAIAKGEPLFTMETDKAQSDVEAPVSGTLAEIRAAAGDVVAAGTAVAIVETTDRAAVGAGAVERSIAPAALELAAQLGIDLDAVAGSGTGGRVIEEDVIRAAQARDGGHGA
jgi:pyruvate dehydrogenase E2 component (dihydrolipoamide acetyltransferase)